MALPAMASIDMPVDDWLGHGVDVPTELPGFGPDLFSTPFDESAEDEFQAMLSDRKSPCMRSSFSMNDLAALQGLPAPCWNHKLVSMKPKLAPVPEGGPSTGGPLNLMPISSSEPATATNATVQMTAAAAAAAGGAAAAILEQYHATVSRKASLPDSLPSHLHPPGPKRPHHLRTDSSEYVDLDSTSSESMPRSHTSCGALAMQLQMTHVKSESQLAPGAEQQQGQQQWAGHSGRGAGLVSLPDLHGAQHAGGAAMPRRSVLGGQSTPSVVDAFSLQGAAIPSYEMLHGGPHQQGGGEVGMGGYPGDPYSQQQPHARRAPSGLPLRKSQSAVELGSWRGGFGSGGGALDDAWDMSMGDEGHAARAGSMGLEERMAKIQRYREKRSATHRGAARAPGYAPHRKPQAAGPGAADNSASGSGGAIRRTARRSSGRAAASESGNGAEASGGSGGSSGQEGQAYAGMSTANSRHLPSHLGKVGQGPEAGRHSIQSHPLSYHEHHSGYSQQQARSHPLYFPPPPPPPAHMLAPPPPPPPAFPFNMVGAAPLPMDAASSGSAPGSFSFAGAASLPEALRAQPPRMLAPCLPPCHPLAGPGPGSMMLQHQQLLAGSGGGGGGNMMALQHHQRQLLGGLAGGVAPMQAAPAHVPPTGQTIFSMDAVLRAQKAAAAEAAAAEARVAAALCSPMHHQEGVEQCESLASPMHLGLDLQGDDLLLQELGGDSSLHI